LLSLSVCLSAFLDANKDIYTTSVTDTRAHKGLLIYIQAHISITTAV